MKIYKNKGFQFLLVAVMIASLTLIGCSKPAEQAPANDNKGPALSGTVTIAGSTSVQPLSEELATAFMAKNSGVRVEVAGGGSGAGVKAAQTKTADIGSASRELKAEETGIKGMAIAIDGIAVIVNPNNGVGDITLAQVKDIFSGKITNWKEVGGKDSQIVVVNREEGSGTRGAFEEIVLQKGDKVAFTDKAIIQNSTGAVREAVSQDVNAIGYISIGGMNSSVKTVKIEGNDASVDNIKVKKYPIARPFNYVINEVQTLSPQAQAYVDFVLSSEGQKIVEENGYIKVK